MFLRSIRKNISNKKIVNQWATEGKPVPPPHIVKQATIVDLKNKYGYTILIETGTYLGEMVEAQLKNFGQIYSIELSEKLYADAKQKFGRHKHIKIIQGDSADVLKDLMPDISKPAMFWLDGHYSAGITAMGKKFCPILEELSAIFNGKRLNHLILIDDARLFVGKEDYPTITELSKYVLAERPSSEITVEDDIIRILIKEY